MEKNISEKLKLSKLLSVLMIVLGVVLLIYMIMVEDEPGALPLLILIIGIVWFVRNRNQIKKQERDINKEV
jgi:uncharacterized membrane protein